MIDVDNDIKSLLRRTMGAKEFLRLLFSLPTCRYVPALLLINLP
jgi:hypothetical protein